MSPNELEKAYHRLKQEVEVGAALHEALLKGQLPKQVPGLSVALSTIPSAAIDGDFFEFYSPSEEQLDIVLGDVMGKGIPAALMGTVIKTQLVRYAMPPAMPFHFDQSGGWHEAILPIEDILSRVHRAINQELIKLEYFVSLIYGRFDLKHRLFSFVDCGFTKPIIYRAAEGQAHFYKGDNFPLGIVPEDHFRPVYLPFMPGDIFLFYSDGMTEARSKEGELFGSERIKDLVEKNGSCSAEVLHAKLQEAVLKFQKADNFQDDLSLIVVKIEPLPTASLKELHFTADLSTLEALRTHLHEVLLSCGTPSKIAQELTLAINEIFCNIVEHGYQGKSGEVKIQIEPSPEGVSVKVADQGIAFNPLALNQKKGLSDRGQGWVIIQKLIDEALYVPKVGERGWNQLRLWKSYYKEK